MKIKKLTKYICLFIMITLFIPKVYAMQIYIHTINGESFNLEVESSDTIEAVKSKIQTEKNILPKKQKLTFQNRTLEEGRTLADYNIQKENTINLFLNLSVTYEIKNVDVETTKVIDFSDDGKILISNEYDYNAKLIPVSGYNMPTSVSVIIGDKELAEAEYSYDTISGNISIRKELLTDDIKVTATADKICKVIFDANGGKYKDGSGTITYDNWHYNDYDNLEKPTKEGWTFVGYYTKKTEGTSLEHIMAESGIDEDITFYARWEVEEKLINPDTYDNIIIYFITLSLSIIGIILIKKTKIKLTNQN